MEEDEADEGEGGEEDGAEDKDTERLAVLARLRDVATKEMARYERLKKELQAVRTLHKVRTRAFPLLFFC